MEIRSPHAARRQLRSHAQLFHLASNAGSILEYLDNLIPRKEMLENGLFGIRKSEESGENNFPPVIELYGLYRIGNHPILHRPRGVIPLLRQSVELIVQDREGCEFPEGDAGERVMNSSLRNICNPQFF